MAGILSALLAQMPTPPELRPPAGLLPDSGVPVWLYAAAVGAILLLAALAWWLSRREAEEPAAPTPLEVAREALRGLHAEGGALEADDFATAACDVVRVFFQEEFSLPATRQTSQEFLAGVVGECGVPGAVHAPLGRFLEAADAARYGRPELQELNRGALLDAAGALVGGAARPAHAEEVAA